jgi:macrolide transport system ATP-binding/permease protein
MNRLLSDIRYALRQLRKSPGFTITAVVTLALGIGANTAIFTLVRGILLRTLPVADPGQLYRIGDTDTCCIDGGYMNDNGDFDLFSYDLFLHLRNSAPEFEQLAAMQAGHWSWSVRRGDSEPKPLNAELVSGNYFSMLGVGAYSGRLFSEQDDTPAASPAVVLSYQGWQGEFAGDPSIVGSTIFIQTKPFTVIGIASTGFFGDRVTDRPPDFWLPLQTEPYVRGESSILHHPDSNWLYALGRVRRGTNIPAVQAQLSGALRQWLSTRPAYTDDGGTSEIPKQHVVIVPGGGGIQTLQIQAGAGLRLLMVLSTVVLLIACANIANLLLARATTRRSDLALRMALGAGRRTVLRQIVLESIVLSCLGGIAGVGVAYAGSRTILALAFPDARNLPIEASPNLTILAFAFLVSMVTGVLFASAPAWLSLHSQPAEALRGVNRSTRDRSSLPQKSLVIFQAALSVVLLTGAILMARSLANLENQNFGIATAHRYVMHVNPKGAGYTTERAPILNRELEERFSSLPGVRNVGMALYSPLEGDNWGECVIQQGHPAPHPGDKCGATWDRVSTHFLDAIGVPIIQGRGFTAQDTATSPFVAVVNETFVKRFFPNQNPIGKHFGMSAVAYSGMFEIVGVFRDFKMNNPREDVRPVFLRAMTQRYAGYKEETMMTFEAESMYLDSMVIDFDSVPSNVDELIRHTVAEIDPNLTVMDVRSMDQQVAENFTQERLVSRLTMLFGILALILASVGLYGVMSYFVVRRTSEIGIRMALGAERSAVMRMVMQGALTQIAIGLAIGIPAALITGHFMASQLYQVRGYDPLALCGAVAVLAVCAAFAGFLPARRAASTEPMQALRIE